MGEGIITHERPAAAQEVQRHFAHLVGDRGAIGKAWTTLVKAASITPSAFLNLQQPMIPDELEVAGNVILIGGGISGRSIISEADLLDVHPEHVDPAVYDPSGIYRKMVKDFDLKGKEIVVITSASKLHAEYGGKELKAIFEDALGVGNVHVIDTHDPKQVDRPENLKALASTPYLFIDGGDQELLAGIFNGSQAQEIIETRLKEDKDFTAAGTSAGAMIMSSFMMNGGQLHKGFKIFRKLMVDTHFEERGRHGQEARDPLYRKETLNPPRLADLVRATEGDIVGIGIDEAAAVRISGTTANIYASGSTQRELREGVTSPKSVTFIVKEVDTEGNPVVRAQRFVCEDGKCVMNIKTSRKVETIATDLPNSELPSVEVPRIPVSMPPEGRKPIMR